MGEVDSSGVPVIRDLASKLTALQRRKEFLSRQLTEKRGSDSSLNFSRAEHSALGAAVDALKFHRTTVDGMDRPLGLLRELMEMVRAGENEPDTLRRAQLVLDEFGA